MLHLFLNISSNVNGFLSLCCKLYPYDNHIDSATRLFNYSFKLPQTDFQEKKEKLMQLVLVILPQARESTSTSNSLDGQMHFSVLKSSSRILSRIPIWKVDSLLE